MTTTAGSTPSPAAQTIAIARTELRLIARSKAVLVSATVVPLVFAAFVLARREETLQASVGMVTMVLAFFAVFTIYLTVTTTFVTRRQDLFLKRLRSGEASDAAILIGLAVPPVLLFVVQTAVVLAVMLAIGVAWPAHWWWVAVAIVGLVVSSVACAVGTTAVTPDASAAQISTMPYVIVVIATLIMAAIVENRFFDLTPGGALVTLVNEAYGATGAGSPLTAVLGLGLWTALGVELAKRRFRWEPRT